MTYTLTTTQISNIRRDTGDMIAPFLLEYDDMAAFFDHELVEGDYAHTVFKCLQLMRDKLSAHLERSGDKREQTMIERRLKTIAEKLEFWEAQAGLCGGVVRVGVLQTHINANETDAE